VLRLTIVACLVALPALSAQSPSTPPAPTAATANERRVVMITVRDRSSRRALEGADVTESLSGATGQSSSDGTIGFAAHRLLPLTIIAKKVGFSPDSVTVATGSGDTARATIYLNSMTRLPAESVIAVAPSAYDDKLAMYGFFTRLQSTAAARSSFVTAADLDRWKPTRITDVSKRIGKPLQACTTYHDGVEAKSIPLRSGRQFRPGLDAMVAPAAVAAMEVYRPMEAPAAYPAKDRDPCVLLLWFK
jgi:hypothetical protein